jgi:hypothetical protein
MLLFNVIPFVLETVNCSQLAESEEGSVVPAPFVLRLNVWKVRGLQTLCPSVYVAPETQAGTLLPVTAAFAAALAVFAALTAAISEALTEDSTVLSSRAKLGSALRKLSALDGKLTGSVLLGGIGSDVTGIVIPYVRPSISS